MRLVERSDALDRLEAAIRSIAGGGAVALVSGEAGIGKTSLIAAFAGAHGGKIPLLTGACDHLAAPRPLGPLIEIASDLGGTRARLEAPGADAARTLFEALRTGGPRVCVVEDVHWADEATLDVLTYLGRRIGQLPVLLVLSFRDDEIDAGHPLRRVIAAMPSDRIHRIALAPLSVGAVAQLAEHVADAAALHAVTGGNPFFVTEVIAGGLAPTPQSVRDAVLSRVADLSPAAREVVELVSVVPGRTELDLVEACLGPTPVALGECEERGMLLADASTVRFRHELARRAVEESLSGAVRRMLNRQVLDALERAEASPARLAHHAGQVGDVDALVRHGIEAARASIEARSHREAAELLERVLEHAERFPPNERAEAFERLSEEAYYAAQPGRAVAARERAIELRRALGDPLATGATLRWMSRLMWWVSDRAAADRTGAEAVALLEALPPSRELAMALSNASQLAMLAQQDEEAIRTGRRAMALARELGDVETLVHAQNNVGSSLSRIDAAAGQALILEAAATAREAGLPEHACRAEVNAAWEAQAAGRYDEARTIFSRGVAYAMEHELPLYIRYHTVLGGMLDLVTGDWDSAERAMGALVEEGLEGTVALIPALGVLGLVELRRGASTAIDRLEAAFALAWKSDELQRIGPAASALAEARWLAGDPSGMDDATADAFALALRVGRAEDIGEIALWRHRAGLLDAPPDRSAEPYALEITGEGRAAARLWASLGAPYAQALALMSVDEPDALLASVEILDCLRATPVAAMARRRLQELGVTGVPRGPRAATRANPAGLTARQAEILDLVAAGLSNGEIARRLVLSPKTVEHHVAAVLAKLGSRTRGEAVAAARALGLVAGSPQTPGRPSDT